VINRITDFAPHGTERGTALALQDRAGRFIFCLAGAKFHGPLGELFYGGIGGHLEEGEDWLSCVHREVKEEIGVDVEIISSPVTWYVSQGGKVQKVKVVDSPQPLGLYELVYPPSLPRAGQLYRIVIYKALLPDQPMIFSKDEVSALIGLTKEQVVHGINRKPSLTELVDEGASIIAGDEHVDLQTRIYPIGTAHALAQIFLHIGGLNLP
jgi:8-oxo-dGTP pyrophosphatase MutT (NUDIX family)